ncbi:amino acid permease-domain-containing protein [Suillus spraguei]|nr:amino acid permease-domain-containing protein [Suillus spraguei]
MFNDTLSAKKSNDVIHVEVLQVNSSGDLPLDVSSRDLVKRRLKQRHIQMYIAGTLGTGLFLGTGPLGALIALPSSLCSLGEMTSLAPISGSFPHFASRWVDPALDLQLPGAQILISLWDSHHAAVYTVVLCILLCATNIFGVIVMMVMTGLIIVGLVIDLGGAPNHQRLGFQYWNNPGAFAGPGLELRYPALDSFLGIWSVITQAGFAYQGIEIVAVAASETENPRRNIAKAIRRVFYRFSSSMAHCTSNNEDLLTSTGSSAESPFVIAMQISGIKVLPAVVNAGFITSAFSAAKLIPFLLFAHPLGLALRKQAPQFFAICTKKGVPIVAVLCSCAFAFLSLMNISSGADTVFNWFQYLTVMGGFFGWLSINITYIFFYRGLQCQGIDRRQLHYWNPLQPWLSVWGAIGITRRTTIWKPDEMDFTTGIPTCEETEGPEIPPKGFWQHIAAVLF